MKASETRFEWNYDKNATNIRKHGIAFRDAIKAFSDVNSFEYRSQGPHAEQRCVLIGSVEGRLVAVIYTVREERIRIISARAARREERNRWNETRS
ncbi:BrnT family toxin [Bosea vestrisii]|uniref:BrnT family toxin n=1 Tax=Bosea vestrisii TaxID=151416 RepID=A0ABW0HCB5_9HYPH